jgi:hypothetical protein
MKFELEPGDTETLQKLKDKAMMLKIICLDELGKDPLFDVSSMNKREKVKLQVEVERKWNDMLDSDIIKLFNEICIQTIFDKNGTEYEQMTCGSVGKAKSHFELEQKEKEKEKEPLVSLQLEVADQEVLF